ncbi:MAG: DNA/RNA nuclease SfsA, partial [Alphaproteobacteria bacterium]|nr:DNA/RNA nuclease SfsA [Alphaproteobacteria bacterium]
NRLVEEAIGKGRIAPLTGYAELRREVPYGENSRIDLKLCDPVRGQVFVEVKSVTLRRPPSRTAEFPDAVTARGTKHLRELKKVAAAGHRAVMIYAIQRADCRSFGVAADIDPEYAAALAGALSGGVEAYCYACRVTAKGIELASELPIDDPSESATQVRD